MPTIKITLPRVSGYRQLAEALVKKAQLDQNAEVEVDGRHVIASTASFASGLVTQIADSHPKEIRLIGGSEDLKRDVEQAAQRVGTHITFERVSA